MMETGKEILAIKTSNLSKKYSGKFVVDEVNMNIPEGCIYGFVGENGSGKTTIMRLLMGLANPTKGDYSLFGVDHKNSNIYKVRKNISSIVEAPSLVPTMTAYENLKFACLYYGVKDLSIIETALKDVGLENTGKKKVKNFSLGMRQRLGIAILLLNSPKLMLLDEPMNGLDPSGIAELRDLILDLNAKGITFVISSHILSELEKVATTYGFISHGKILQEISAEDLNNAKRSGIELRHENLTKLDSALKSIGIKDMSISAHSIKVFDDISASKLLIDLDKKGIVINSIKTLDANVEDYYLQLVNEKGGNK